MKFLKKLIKRLIKNIFDFGNSKVHDQMSLLENKISQVEQINLMLYYKQLQAESKFVPSIKDVGFSVFSQNDEDGILLYIFSLIGTTNKTCLDIAFVSPFGANTTNLLCNLGYNGLLICPSEEEKKQADIFFAKHPGTKVCPPKIVNAWITRENVNDLLLSHGVYGQIDLLSLDIDGVDYWIWDAINVCSPRVVVVEFQSFWGHEHSKTVPYFADFDKSKFHENFFGASLLAFVKLANKKGYKLVGCNKYGFNAFFVKSDLCDAVLPELSTKTCFEIYKQPSWVVESRIKRLNVVKNMDWLEV